MWALHVGTACGRCMWALHVGTSVAQERIDAHCYCVNEKIPVGGVVTYWCADWLCLSHDTGSVHADWACAKHVSDVQILWKWCC